MIEITMFGATSVRACPTEQRGVGLAGVKPRRVLQILAAELGRPVTKDVLAEGLWDGRPPASYVASVESYVCVLRRSLSAMVGQSPLVTTHGAYLLDPELVRVDLVEARTLLTSLERASGERLVRGAEQVLERMQGDLLADEPFAEWARQIRRRFDDLLETVLTRAAEAATSAGQGARAVRLARTAAEHGPLSEPASRALMTAYRAVGSRPQALRVYADLRALMVEELGSEPSASTQALYLSLLEDECPGRSGGDRREVRTLVRLLRQALEAGVRPDPATRSWLAEVGQLAAGPSV